MSLEPHVSDRVALRRFLGALYWGPPPTALVEVRCRLGQGMGQTFYPVTALDAVADAVLARSAVTDVFVGVVPRSRRGGGSADLIKRSGVVWADCDGADAFAALKEFRPPPAMVVASGTGENRHAYWFLRVAIDIASMVSINRRLAVALGADQRSADSARILRPAGSVNRKHDPPAAVRLLRLVPRSCVAARELQAVLPLRQVDVSMWPRAREIRVDASDPLRAISPQVYVARLTGQRVGRSAKIRCPFHDDHTPSLHVYEDAERGWYCFGCGRGGSIYDFAALVWQRRTGGTEFLELRRDLEALLS